MWGASIASTRRTSSGGGTCRSCSPAACPTAPHLRARTRWPHSVPSTSAGLRRADERLGGMDRRRLEIRQARRRGLNASVQGGRTKTPTRTELRCRLGQPSALRASGRSNCATSLQSLYVCDLPLHVVGRHCRALVRQHDPHVAEQPESFLSVRIVGGVHQKLALSSPIE